jgi:hypothetical protein
VIRLVPGEKDDRAFPDEGSLPVFLGKPIASVRLADLEAEATKAETRERFAWSSTTGPGGSSSI